jgi:hypothetical protein
MSLIRMAASLGILSVMLLTACVTQVKEPVWCKMPEDTRSDLYAPPVLLHGELRSARLPDFTGAVIVEQCVDESGHLAREPRIVDSSHIATVDAAAVEYARQQQFLPARRGGQAVAGCCLTSIGMVRANGPSH